MSKKETNGVVVPNIETNDFFAQPAKVQDAPQSGKEKAAATAKKYAKRYFIDAFTGMAQGLFCTLIAGTILAQIAGWFGTGSFAATLNYMASIAKMLMGAGIGIGIAHKLGAKPLVIFTAAVTGLIGAWAGNLVAALCDGTPFVLKFGLPGNPIGSYVVALFSIEIARAYAGKTKLDIVLVPLGMMLLCVPAIFVAWPFIKLIDQIAVLLVLAINAGATVTILVGIFVSVVMGILLTMPTSSAAIWIAIATSNTAVANPEVFAIAGGAAVVGCAAQMVGFAVMSYKENRFGGLISQGLGTSMLQIPNIMKHPIIFVPPIIASAIVGPIACAMGIRCTAAGGGMGTSGLVGVFGVIDASAGVPTVNVVMGIIFLMFVIPAIVSLFFRVLFEKKGWLKGEWLKLDV